MGVCILSYPHIDTCVVDKPVLNDVIAQTKLLKEERKKITSLNLALLLVHDLLFSHGIQAGDGPIKQAILRHKTRLHSELEKIKIKRGVKLVTDLAQDGDGRAGCVLSPNRSYILNQFHSSDPSLYSCQCFDVDYGRSRFHV